MNNHIELILQMSTTKKRDLIKILYVVTRDVDKVIPYGHSQNKIESRYDEI